MATGFDKLIDYLLSEIALCGVQGAGSAEFYRFIQNFYNQSQAGKPSPVNSTTRSGLPSSGFGRTFHERVWDWVSNHSDIRITYKNEVKRYSLSDFEAVELQEKGTSAATTSRNSGELPHTSANGISQPSSSLLAMRGALRERLVKEGHGSNDAVTLTTETRTSTLSRQQPRRIPEVTQLVAPIFDDPEPTVIAPRLYASQSRIWQALTGHGIDLKKVPSMEFILLSIIASRGADGIAQPDLTHLSGQDKRSVPHRTNELARKGYIVKNPVQAGKTRTSLCVHIKFISQDHFLSSSAVEDVYKEGTFVLSGFVHLLYNKLKDAGIVPTRDMRKKLGVPMRTWNKRATQGALIRLDQTGMIKRFRVRKKHSSDSWVTCVQVLREPRDEDVNNLGFRRQATATDEMVDELLDEDVDGDTLMRDLEVDMLDDDADNNTDPQNAIEDAGRIPPQWTPDRLIANIAFEAVALGGSIGMDAGVLRDRTVGPFWRRPMESYVFRLTDDWEKTQPLPLRHLTIIRDSQNTHEKKFIHYVYRTYENFQKAADVGEVQWEGVRKPAPDENDTTKQEELKKHAAADLALNAWGFPNIKSRDLVAGDGSATLSDVRSAIVHPRKYGPRWDNALTLEIGYEKSETPITKLKPSHRKPKSQTQEGRVKPTRPPTPVVKVFKAKPNGPNLSLTLEERISLGLKPNGRLSKNVEKQIRAHRRATGDPTSLPDKIEEEISLRGQAPLMTAEERVARGLPAKGRLGIARENEIREERGLAKITKKPKKREKNLIKEPALLSKEQRLAFGWKGHGRLPQDLIDGLRREREDGISLEDSKVLPKYMDMMKAKAGTLATPEPVKSAETQASPSTSQHVQDRSPELSSMEAEIRASLPPNDTGKRKAQVMDSTSKSAKKQRTEALTSMEEATSPNENVAAVLTTPSISPDEAAVMPVDSRNGTPLAMTIEENTETTTPAPRRAVGNSAEVVHPSHSLHSPASGIMSTGVGLQQLRTPSTSTHAKAPPRLPPPSVLVQPDASNLEPQARLEYERYMNRSTSGLYLNPFAKHKSRGRPRKALIATFKLPRLHQIEWFDSHPSHSNTPHMTGPGVDSSSTNNAFQQGEGDLILPSRIVAQIPPVVQPQDDTIADQNSLVTNELGSPRAAILTGRCGNESEEQMQSTSHAGLPTPEPRCRSTSLLGHTEVGQEPSQVETQSPEPSIEVTRVPFDADRRMPDLWLSQQRLVAPTDGLSAVSAEQSMESELPVSRGSAAWAAINTSALHNPSPYQSPYAPSSRSESNQPPETGKDGQVADVSVASTSLLPSPLVEENRNMPPPKEVHGVIPKNRAPTTRKVRSRAKKGRSAEGSALLFRIQIIREIIDLCHGAFPNSGEIGRPFHKLWVERHGHKENLKQPIASTVNATVRLMCNTPRFGLKRMTFLVNQQKPYASEKSMIIYSHYTASTPVVAQLASNVEYCSLEKSNQYFPEEIRHLIDDTSLYTPAKAAPKDESIVLTQVIPEVEAKIKAAQRENRNRVAREKRQQAKARKVQNAQVEQGPTNKDSQVDNASHTKRARLASLNDKNKRYHREPLQTTNVGVVDEEREHVENGQPNAAATDQTKQTSLIWTRPWIAPILDHGTVEEGDESSETEELDDESSDPPTPASETRTQPVTDHNYVLSEETSDAKPNNEGAAQIQHSTDASVVARKGEKRVRLTVPSTRRPQKRPRRSTEDSEIEHRSSSESEISAPSAADEDEEDDEEAVRPKKKTRTTAYQKRQRGRPGPLPTLLERLTGLTGDPNDPIYNPPTRQQRANGTYRPRSGRKKQQVNKKKERKYMEFLDPVDRFKKLSCTLVIASSMSGEDGSVDWGIVEKVYSGDKLFNATRTKKLWIWMQANMAAQVTGFTTSFQSSFLEAYEDGIFAAIEDPDTYDWANVVQWAMRQVAYPEIPLPLYREALRQFVVDESNYEALDRLNWYQKKVADRVRIQLQLHTTFVAPLHRSRHSGSSPDDKVLKARSWVRANTATPQARYNGSQAHDKLMILGTPILTTVVGDYVEQQNLRMRKIKRLLPGRNYSFTKAFAKKYVRPFELSEFMAAVKVKKDMDTAFANQDPEKRWFSIARSEPDGAVTAILSLAGEGKVMLVPQLPPVNSEFGAPLPRISVWGFCEGDYIHRSIDRNRLFWDIHVVPTAKYQFGNPLQPLPFPPAPTDTGEPAEWPSLPDPPLPGKHDPDALLPIWSSIDGQSITWPWWYRILNLVLQPLVFQPGATAADVFAHCPEHTTELFEVELVLSWLVTVNAVSKTIGEGYVTNPSFWAAFGDKLLDTEDDWFGEHVKRKAKNHEKQGWREQYNLRHSTLQEKNVQGADSESPVEEENSAQEQTQDLDESTRQKILKHPKRQYSIIQQALRSSTQQAEEERASPTATPSPATTTGPIVVEEQTEHTPDAEDTRPSISQTPDVPYTPGEDIEMADAEGEDVDAEGEVDDAVY